MSRLIKPKPSDRSKIHVDDPVERKCWARKLGISEEQLLDLVAKFGNAAATVSKEIGVSKKLAKPE